MTADEYLLQVINRYRVKTGQGSPAYSACSTVYPIIKKWAGDELGRVTFSGSYAKGTAIRGRTDVDLFISLKSDTTETIEQVFYSLHAWMRRNGYPHAKKQKVSVHINHNGIEIDLVPGVNHSGNTENHWLYVNRPQRHRIQTNVSKHVNLVKGSNRVNEILAIKIWRQLNDLEFPSFYLELAVIEALSARPTNQIGSNVWEVFRYLHEDFVGARFVDPANSNNVISDELTPAEQLKISVVAGRARGQSNWSNILW